MKNYFSVLIVFLSFLFQTSGEASKPFVIGSSGGGLGNQMFQVATTCALAWDNGADPYFPDFTPTLPYADSSVHHVFYRCLRTPPNEPTSIDWLLSPFGYEPIFFQNSMRIYGCAHNELYFAHHRNRLIQFFAPRESDMSHIRRRYQNILDHPNSVCVHVRYYYAEHPNDPAFRQYDEEYYEKALSHFPAEALIVVISDNMDFAKRIISQEDRNVIFIENEPYFIDFFLQTLCKHNIIANSSFSWWGAWLNQNPDKIVFRPKEWRGSRPDIGGPHNWIKITAQSLQEKM